MTTDSLSGASLLHCLYCSGPSFWSPEDLGLCRRGEAASGRPLLLPVLLPSPGLGSECPPSLTLWPLLRSVLSRCGAGTAVLEPRDLVTPCGRGPPPCPVGVPEAASPRLLGLWHVALGRQGQGHGWAAWGLTWRFPGSGLPRHPLIPEASCPQIL